MNQTWENGKKPNFGPVFCRCDPTLGRKIFVHGFCLDWIVDIVSNYHCNLFKENL